MSEVGVARLRQELKEWLARAQAGDEVIVTDRGKPVARLTGIEVPPLLEQLVAEGKVTQPRRPVRALVGSTASTGGGWSRST